MPDPRFFRSIGPTPLGAIAAAAEGELADPADAGRLIGGVAPLDAAGPGDLSFLDNRKYVPELARTRAGAVVIASDLAKLAPKGTPLILSRQPYRAYALAAQHLYPEAGGVPGVHPSAVVDPTAVLAAGVTIGANAVVGPRAELGEGVRIGPCVVLGAGVVIGAGTIVGANASVENAIVGARVRLYPGVRIGQDGFGFAMDARGHVKVPQLGRVLIGDDVEIGANSTIDRGSGPDTVIGDGAMIDNLVQIGHNVELGPGSVMVAMSGISGSTKVGRLVAIGGQVGIAGHLKIGDGAKIAAKSGIMQDVPPGASVMGYPAVPSKQFFRQVAMLARMTKGKGD